MASRDIDVSGLPSSAFGHHEPLWWGNLGLIAIEGTVFALAIATYFYLRQDYTNWPPEDAGYPSYLAAIVNVCVLVASLAPMSWIERNAEHGSQQTLRWMLLLSALFMAGSIVCRVFEFRALHTYWDSNSYGSITWTILGLHTTHLVASLLETLVLAHYSFVRPLDPHRRFDLAINSLYWYFVVIAWVVLASVVYAVPHLL